MTEDDVRIAYQEFGGGPPTVYVPSLFTHLEGQWEHELVRRLFDRMAANLRVLTFDHRGAGMSDGYEVSPTLSERALDIQSVLDAARIERANLIGFEGGAQVAVAFAASRPERVERLVVVNARVGRSAAEKADELNPGADEPLLMTMAESHLARADTHGTELGEDVTLISPSAAKYPDYLRWLVRARRLFGPRDAYKRQVASIINLDIADVAPLVRAPTLITHTAGNRLFHVGYARLLAELIPDAALVEIEGDDQDYLLADNWSDIVDAHIRFITGADVQPPVQRRFAVVLFTDLVGSTQSSMASGDEHWHRQLDTHDRISREVVSRTRGSIIKHTGDGQLATFDAPSQAIDAAKLMHDRLTEAGMIIRAGIHAGEVEIRGHDISGAVVNLAARVQETAEDGRIRTTAAIKDLLIGSDFRFEAVGSHDLQGFDEPWTLYRVTD